MLLAAVLAALAAPASADDAARSAEQLEKLRGRIATLEQALERDRSRRDELGDQIEASERRAVELGAELALLRDKIDEQSARRRRTEQQRREADGSMQRARKSLARQVRASYIIGQRGQTKLALNQDRSQQLSRVMTYYDYLNRARARQIEKILDQVQVLQALSEKLRAEGAELDATRSHHESTLGSLEALRAERQQMVRALRDRIAGEEGELQQLQADEKQLTRLLRELRKTLDELPGTVGGRPFKDQRGKLPWPLRGKLLAQYGQPKSGRLKWGGLWIAGAEGAPVRAVADGRVAYTGWMHRYGLIAVIEHEGGYYSLYGHTQSVAVTAGDWVQAGERVASVGNTGGHERNGLYFELRRGTESLNPGPWLRLKK
ncbi:MAG: murein hydrolase activator EnvC family protein [Gammaproteobacteria bacterium]